MSPCGECKYALFVSIICLSITWGPARSPASSVRQAGSQRWGQSGPPSPDHHQEESVSLTRSNWSGTPQTVPVHFLHACLWLQSSILMHVSQPMTVQTGMRTDTDANMPSSAEAWHWPRGLKTLRDSLTIRMGVHSDGGKKWGENRKGERKYFHHLQEPACSEGWEVDLVKNKFYLHFLFHMLHFFT